MRKLLHTGLLLLAAAGSATAGIVADHGALKVKGNQIVDASGTSIQVAGMSFFWSGWMGSFYRTSAVNTLAKDWKASVVRAALGVEGSGNYLYSPESNKKLITTVVDAAIKNDIYVIVDWHDHNANLNIEQAKTFFSEMAQTYKNTPNVIWEIWNEPESKNGTGPGGKDSWSLDIRPYAESMIAEIRKYSSNLVIVGTPNWSQDVDSAAKNPVSDSNTAYALHFYAGSHFGSFRTKANNAMSKGAAIFITEWGTSMANGGTTGNPPVNDNYIDTVEANDWLDWAQAKGISWCNWSVSDKDESSAALEPGASPNGGWPDSMISPSGLYVRRKIREVTARISPGTSVRRSPLRNLSVRSQGGDLQVQLPENSLHLKVVDLQGRSLLERPLNGERSFEASLPISGVVLVQITSKDGLLAVPVTLSR